MQQPETLVTPSGLQKLQGELDHLVNVRRPQIAARIKEARELGDLKENAEYHDAKNEQGFIETKIKQLEEKLRTARIVEQGDTSKVGIGTVVTVHDVGEDEAVVYTITDAAEADPIENCISNDSPIGSALLGRSVGETVTVTLPRGSMELRIEHIAAAS